MSKYVYLYKVDYLEKSNIYKFGTIEDKTMIKNIQSNNPNKLTILKNSNVIFHMLVDNLTNIIKDKIINIFKTTFIFHKNEYYEGNYKQMIDIIYCIITNENITPNLIKNINENEKINYVYLLIEREFILLDKNIYKIGRSERKNYTRFLQYSNDSVLLFQIKCNDCKKMEKKIINIFKKNFSRQKRIGNEYFDGDLKKMISLMYDAVKNENNLTNEIDKKTPLNKELFKKMQIEKNINYNQLFMNYCCEKKNIRNDEKYISIHNEMKKLGIHEENKEIFDKFINIIKSDKEIIKHQNLIKILKNKTINNCDEKISLIKKIENDNDISILNLNFSEDEPVIIDDLTYKCLKNKFCSKKKKPINKHSLKVFYISMLKNLCNEMIFSKASNKLINNKLKKITKYFLNIDRIKLSLELEKFVNPKIYEEIIFDNLIM